MRILLVNVNTTESMTRAMGDQAQAVAAEGTEIVALTPFFGAESVEGNYESYLAAVAVMDRVLAVEDDFDAVIQAGFGEHGREGLQELLDVPVVDITEAAVHLAYLLGYRYSVITTLDRAIPLIEQRLLLSGLDARCASVRASGLSVLQLDESAERATAAIAEQSKLAIEEDGAEVIVLGCGGMVDLETAVLKATAAPVVDGVSAAVKVAESLVSLKLSTSKVRTYAAPRPKNVRSWPLHRHLPGTPRGTE